MNGYRSVFSTQLLAFRKSSSVDVEVGREIDHVTPEVRPRKKSLIGAGVSVFKKVKTKK